jgi:glycosyltransferase involved in cell wall biosynthesis
MVTRGRLDLVRESVAGFMAQSWPSRELVVVCDDVSEGLRELLAPMGEQARLVEAPRGLSLGDLRNLAIARASGAYVCQWDDDDLYDPDRIGVCMQVLQDAGVDAVFLSRWLFWWPDRQVLAQLETRIWEGSILARRSVMPVYPSLPRAEDTSAIYFLLKHRRVALVDAPHLYCYRVTGHNTWDAKHFEDMLSRASRIFRPDEHAAVLRQPCFSAAGLGM